MSEGSRRMLHFLQVAHQKVPRTLEARPAPSMPRIQGKKSELKLWQDVAREEWQRTKHRLAQVQSDLRALQQWQVDHDEQILIKHNEEIQKKEAEIEALKCQLEGFASQLRQAESDLKKACGDADWYRQQWQDSSKDFDKEQDMSMAAIAHVQAEKEALAVKLEREKRKRQCAEEERDALRRCTKYKLDHTHPRFVQGQSYVGPLKDSKRTRVCQKQPRNVVQTSFAGELPQLQRIVCRSGWYIDALEFHFRNASPKYFGGFGGTEELSKTLQESEYITAIKQLPTWEPHGLGMQISLMLSSGRAIAFQGSRSGSERHGLHEIHYEAKLGHQIVGLKFNEKGHLCGITEHPHSSVIKVQ